MKIPGLNRYISVVSIVLLLMAGIFYAGRAGLRDLDENAVNNAIESWYLAGTVPSLSAWSETYARVSRLAYGEDYADRIASAEFREDLITAPVQKRFGHYFHLLALVYEWRLYVDEAPVSIFEELSYRDLVIHAWSASTKVRPAWPEDWAELAKHKAYLGEFDEYFYKALLQSIKLGKHESGTQVDIIQTATLSWPYLNTSFEGTDVKNEVLATMESALSSVHNAASHLALLSDSGILGEVCAGINMAELASRALRACEAVR